MPPIRVNAEPPTELIGAPDFNRYIFSVLSSLEVAWSENNPLPQTELAQTRLDAYLKRRYPADGGSFVVLIFDQFEEILTTNIADQQAKYEFFVQLDEALADSTHWAIFAMREDYIGGLNPYLLPIRLRFNNTFRLDLLSDQAARNVMVKTAKQENVDFKPEAAQRLADDLRQVLVQRADRSMEKQLGPYVEPVQLQVVCHRLWDNLEPGDLDITEDEVANLGDVNRALAEYYDACVDDTARTTGLSQPRHTGMV